MYTILAPPTLMPIGNEGEVGSRKIEFQIAPWQADYPQGAGIIAVRPGLDDGLYISYIRSGETPSYPELTENLSLSGSVLTWKPGAAVLDEPGQGSMVVHCVDSGDEVRATMIATIVTPGHPSLPDAPLPLGNYIKKWGAIDVDVYRIDNSLDPEATITQDDTGTHLVLGIPVNALMRDIENTRQLATLNGDGTVAQVLHTDLDTQVIMRTDDFVYFGDLLTQTRTLADGSYLTITSNLLTMEQTISNIVKGA